MLLNNEWVKNEIREEIKNLLETSENELTISQNLCDSKDSPGGKLIAIQAYLQKHRNISNKQPNPTPIRTRETTTNPAQNKKKDGNNQDQSRTK